MAVPRWTLKNKICVDLTLNVLTVRCLVRLVQIVFTQQRNPIRPTALRQKRCVRGEPSSSPGRVRIEDQCSICVVCKSEWYCQPASLWYWRRYTDAHGAIGWVHRLVQH